MVYRIASPAIYPFRRQNAFYMTTHSKSPMSYRSIFPSLSNSSLAAMTSACSYPLFPELAFLTISPSFDVAISSSFLTVAIFGIGTSSSSWLPPPPRLLDDVDVDSNSKGISFDETSLRP